MPPGTTPPPLSPGLGLLVDVRGLAEERYGARAERLDPVRADLYIGYRGQPADAARLGSYLGQILCLGNASPRVQTVARSAKSVYPKRR